MDLPTVNPPPADEEILLGDEAVARGALDAGISAAYAYPGTPATEIHQSVMDQARAQQRPLRGLWSANEKVALEQAVGVSYAGRRALVSMKHVGLNVAADPFINVGISGTHGGLVVVVADDPSMHSSQNEQDSRFYADFALVPCLEPADQQQCYDFTREAFELSERLRVPVLLRLVTRLAHSRAAVRTRPQRAPNEGGWASDPERFTLIPAHARRAYAALVDKQPALQAWSGAHMANRLQLAGERRPGIVVSGIAWNYLSEALGARLAQFNVLRIGAYPLPVAPLRRLLEASDELTVIEEGQPFIERQLAALSLMREHRIFGRLSGALPRAGELGPDVLKRCFGLPVGPALQLPGLAEVLAPRPPRLCDQCPHADAYRALNEAVAELGGDVRVMGDIGCYTLGALAPLHAIHSCLCMGASIGMAMGAAHAGMTPALCVIGDGTFTHSGMAPLLDAARDDTDLTVLILDNALAAMTGGQPTPADGERLVELIAGLGVPRAHIRLVEPTRHHHAQTVAVLREEVAHRGLSVVIARRACVTYAKQIKARRRGEDGADE